MRIKAVCEATGLTDRTIRYYIEEGLLSPSFEENYLGRKTYDFTETDIRTLQNIAILRKYGFSIAQIKRILQEPSESIAIIKEIQAEKQKLISQEQAQLQALLRLEADRAYTVSELAECLDVRDLATELPSEDTEFHWSDRFWNACGYCIKFAIIWAPILLAVIAFLENLHTYYYPKWRLKYFFFLALTLSPSILLLLRRRFRFLQRYRVKYLLFSLCLLMPLPALLMSSATAKCSETRDLLDYRRFDVNCVADSDPLFQELFPQNINFWLYQQYAEGDLKRVNCERDYYYRYTHFNYSNDIYMGYNFKAGFKEEAERVTRLFKSYDYDKAHFKIVQKGAYTCLFMCWGEEPFAETTDQYTYYMFAYNEDTGDVRYYYGACYERDWAQPYYLSLTWD